MLERCARRCAGDADVWSSLGTCLAALGQHLRADDAFRRAARLDPTYPLHHWNAAAIARQLGDLDRCYRALRRFLDLSDRPGRAPVAAVDADRVGTAQQIVADLERTARLTGRPLPAPPLPVRAARPTATRRRPTARP
jgi:tetratricopeptide (TPR) repeat protein